MAALAGMAALDLRGGAMVPAGAVPGRVVCVGSPRCRRFQAVLMGMSLWSYCLDQRCQLSKAWSWDLMLAFHDVIISHNACLFLA